MKSHRPARDRKLMKIGEQVKYEIQWILKPEKILQMQNLFLNSPNCLFEGKAEILTAI